MKKITMIAGLLLLIFLIIFILYRGKNISKNKIMHREIISKLGMNVYSSTYPYLNKKIKLFDISNIIKNNLKLIYWKNDLYGKTKISIEDDKNKIIKEIILKNELNEKIINLDQGEYSISISGITSIFGGYVIGWSKEFQSLEDKDNDCLPDIEEKKYGSNINKLDTDKDGLTDYEEIVKYRTNPIKKDSDKDGKIDGEWNERREYTYTIQAIVDLNVPHRISDMNNIYQDARFLKNITDNCSRIEVILYPDSYQIINPKKHIEAHNEYTEKTFTKNYSKEMSQFLIKKINKNFTDYEIINIIISELKRINSVDIIKELKMEKDMPLDFSLINDSNEIIIAPERKSSKYSMKEIASKVLFADSMYKGKTRGACGSTAILRGGMLRSIGLQERSIFTIPIFYSLDSDKTIIKVNKEKYDTKYLNLPSSGSTLWVDHVLSEVFFSNQWVQVDFIVRDTFKSYGLCWYIKTISFSDPSEVDFYNRYFKLDFFKERPYKYISIIEQKKKY